MSDVHDVIEAFIDGEYVDPPLLKQALSEEAGRDLLVDLLVLRGLVAGQPATRAAAADAPRSRSSWLRLVAAAACIAAVGVLGGYLAGLRHTPEVARPAPVIGAPAAPAPTHIIRLENGIDWNEKVGG
jgi:hypothetical protein